MQIKNRMTKFMKKIFFSLSTLGVASIFASGLFISNQINSTNQKNSTFPINEIHKNQATNAPISQPIVPTNKINNFNNVINQDYYFTSKDNSTTNINLNYIDGLKQSNLQNGQFSKMFEDSYGQLWVLSPGQKLQHTSDYGKTWIESPTSNIVDGEDGLIFEDSNGALWAMGNGTQLQVSRNHGITWDNANPTSNISNGKSGAFFEDSHHILWSMGWNTELQYSKDSGITWEVPINSPISNGNHGKFFEDSKGRIWVVGGENIPIQYTYDGDLWKNPLTLNIRSGLGGGIFEDSKGTLWAWGDGAPLQKNESGTDIGWSEISNSPIDDGKFATFFEDSKGTLWASSHNNPFKFSTDRGATWTSPTGLNMTQGDYSNIFEDSNNVLWITTPNNPLQFSIDGGLNWKEAKNNSNIIDSHSAMMFQDSRGNLWSAGKGKTLQMIPNYSVYKFNVEWINNLSTLPSQTFFKETGITTLNSSGNFVWEDSTGKIWIGSKETGIKTSKDGLEFNDINPAITDGSFSHMIETSKGTLIFNSFRNKLKISVDKGKTWTEPPTSNVVDGFASTILFEDSRHRIWSGSSSKPIQYSDDDGKSWYKSSIPILNSAFAKMFETKDNTLWVMGQKSKLMHSFDGGVTWTEPPTSNITDGELGSFLQDSNDNLWSMGHKTPLQFSEDNGNTWKVVGTGVVTLAEGTQGFIFEDSSHNIWCGSKNNGIKYTSDFGKSWHASTVNIVDADGAKMFEDSNNTLWIMAQNVQTKYSNDHGQTWIDLPNSPQSSSYYGGFFEDSRHIVYLLPTRGKFLKSFQVSNVYEKIISTERKTLKVDSRNITVDYDGEIIVRNAPQIKGMHLEYTIGDSKVANIVSSKIDKIIAKNANTYHFKWVQEPGFILNPGFIKPSNFDIEIKKLNIKPVINTSFIDQPTTTTSIDGEITFNIEHFDPSIMNISKTISSGGFLANYDPITKNCVLSNLSSGEVGRIKISLISGEKWADDTINEIYSQEVNMNQTYVGFQKTEILSRTTHPSNNTSTDGSILYSLINFDSNNMIISKSYNSPGTLESYDPIQKTIRLNNLKVGDHPKIKISFIHDTDKFIDGSSFIESKNIVITEANINPILEIPKVSPNIKVPTSETNSDGEITFTLLNYDPLKVNVELAPDSPGQLDNFIPDAKSARVINLQDGDKVKLKFSPKYYNLGWIDGTSLPKYSREVIVHFINPILNKPTFSKTEIKNPTTSFSNDGRVIFSISDYDPNTMNLEVVDGSGGNEGAFNLLTHKIEFNKLVSGDFVQLKISPKIGLGWKDSTLDPILSSKINMLQTYQGISKPTITSKITKIPSSNEKESGEITFYFLNLNNKMLSRIFDKSRVSITIVKDKKGIIGEFNVVDKSIKVTNLSLDDDTQIKITLNNNEYWVDGTNMPITSEITSLKNNIESNGMTDNKLVLIIGISIGGTLLFGSIIYKLLPKKSKIKPTRW